MLHLTISGETERLVREYAPAQNCSAACLVRALIHNGLNPDRGPTIRKPWGRDGDAHDVQVTQGGTGQ